MAGNLGMKDENLHFVSFLDCPSWLVDSYDKSLPIC